MMVQGKISGRQFTVLLTLNTIGVYILIIPSVIVSRAKQDAWLALTLAIIMALAISTIYMKLIACYPGLSLAQMFESAFGKILGKIVSMCFFFGYPLFISTLVLHDEADFMKTILLPKTPKVATMILFMAIVVMAMRFGLETLSRTAELFFPVVIILFLIFTVVLIPQLDMNKLTPVLENGFKPVLKTSIHFVVFFLDSFLFLTLLPNVKTKTDHRMLIIVGTLIGALVLIIITLLCVGVIGVKQTEINLFSSYALAKKISIGHFLERIEVVLAFIWFISIFYSLAILYLISLAGIAQTLNLRDYKSLAIPFCFISIVLALGAFPNTNYFVRAVGIWYLYAVNFVVLLPLMMLIANTIKKAIR